ncbi:hypothetical protein BT93_C2235 [Corymbia citriodora subsp. variegata]|nr:hypothetical protein BT93_C2235 [Corymbia citriodora subsp. variegata]
MTLPDTKSSQEIMSRACELHEGDGFGKYDIINNNCENFTLFCRTVIWASAQTVLVSTCKRKVKEVKKWVMKFLQTN